MVPCRFTWAWNNVDYPLGKACFHSQFCKLQSCQGRDLEVQTGFTFLEVVLSCPYQGPVPSFVGVVHEWDTCKECGCAHLWKPEWDAVAISLIRRLLLYESEACCFSGLTSKLLHSICSHPPTPDLCGVTGTLIFTRFLSIWTQVPMLANM